jgi:non-heme chloroperoxidase
VDTDNSDRGALLIVSGEKDHTVPWAAFVKRFI